MANGLLIKRVFSIELSWGYDEMPTLETPYLKGVPWGEAEFSG